ncbi:unnamed protein product [Hymenolepis diminuta]|uniref:Uncharacterized protein n=1 Tax=Hymenolepis diminuta TaxID=6216 RepID=A0A0R3SJ34_HYMDI|nr:unnamed protein product [Hymenolepis diminuta]
MQITCVPSCLFTWQLDRDTNAFSGPLLTPGHATQKGIVPLNSTTSGSTVRINRLVSASSILNSTFIKTTPKLDLTNLSSVWHKKTQSVAMRLMIVVLHGAAKPVDLLLLYQQDLEEALISGHLLSRIY